MVKKGNGIVHNVDKPGVWLFGGGFGVAGRDVLFWVVEKMHLIVCKNCGIAHYNAQKNYTGI